MAHELVEFTGSHNETISARIDLPEGGVEPKGYILYAHCFSCNKDLTMVHRISKALTAHHIAMFRFDFTGLGGSGGEFSETNFSSNIADLICAANVMRERYRAPSVLLGHSLGGTACIAAKQYIPEVKGVATIGSPFGPAHIKKHLGHLLPDILAKGHAEAEIAGRKFLIKKQYFDDMDLHDMEEYIKQLGCALLVMHSPVDETVNISNAREIFQIARHPKSFISLDHADHLLTHHREDSVFVAKILAAWIERYL